MTLRQSVLKFFYPLLMALSRFSPNGKILVNKNNTVPHKSFYELTATANNRAQINFSSFRGKKILIVNTASDCGYTAQYEELQKLYEEEKENLEILAFPANDFGEQEKGNDDTIATFCKVNYGISFTQTKKCVVIKNENQHLVFKWLTNKNENGWNSEAPVWNFCKYLVDEKGNLTHYFGTAISPTGKKMRKAVTAR